MSLVFLFFEASSNPLVVSISSQALYFWHMTIEHWFYDQDIIYQIVNKFLSLFVFLGASKFLLVILIVFEAIIHYERILPIIHILNVVLVFLHVKYDGPMYGAILPHNEL